MRIDDRSLVETPEQELARLRVENLRMVEFLSVQLSNLCINRNVNDIEHKVLDLLTAGADPNFETGKTAPLFSCMKNVNLYGLFETLLRFKADPNWCDPVSGQTALHVALKKDDPFYVKLLVSNGANPALVGPEGSAIEMAEKQGFESHVVDMMRAAAARFYATEALVELEAYDKNKISP